MTFVDKTFRCSFNKIKLNATKIKSGSNIFQDKGDFLSSNSIKEYCQLSLQPEMAATIGQ